MIALTDNPPAVFTGTFSAENYSDPWWIGHTKSRAEKAFAWDLIDQQIGYFLPMLERSIISGGRRRRVLKPLFPSYVFFRGDGEARQRALQTGRLCQVLKVPNQEQLDRELAAIQIALANNPALDLYPFVAVGRRCRVGCGPMQGLEGIVLDRNDIAKVVLQVTMLGQGVLLEIDAGFLEAAEEEQLSRAG